jgi:hypothetical protein
MAENIFVNGMIVKKPQENAPDFVKMNISIKTEDMVKFLEEHTKGDGWCNITVKESREGKYYASLNQFTVTPKKVDTPEISAEEIAF